MPKKRYKGKLRRVLPALLAAVLWIEGTFGSVCAAEPVPQTEQTVLAEENAAAEEMSDAESEENTAPEEENAESEKTETPEKEENGETEEPEEGESSDAEGKETSDGTEEEETDPAMEEETVLDTVSENALGQEEEEESEEDPVYDGECFLGEPPLMTGYGVGNTVYSYNRADVVRSGESGKLQTPSTVDIIQRYRDYPWSLSVGNTYSDTPSTKNPYKAGHLSNDSLVNALNLMNFIRYVAGIPSDVTVNEEYTQRAQAGALLNCVNGKLEHNPTQKPSGFPDDLYETGKKGCSSSNIAMGYGNIAQTLLNGWMYDGDSSNINLMGHRRWVLNPSMKQTGFGAVGAYSAMYAFDSSGSTVTDFVAWPARNMPIELMNGSGTPWTVSLGSDYGKADFQKVRVTLQNLSNNKTYTFSSTKADGVFKVNTNSYGMANCIIFRPNNISYGKTSQFRVTITGLTNADGTDAESLGYNVDFFSLSDKPEEVREVTLNKDRLHFLKNEEGKEKETLFVTIKPSNATDKTLTWKEGDKNVVTVDENGNVKAEGVGETTVSVTAANGIQDVCVVKVSDYALSSDSPYFNKKEVSLALDLTSDKEPQKLTVLDGTLPATGDWIQWMSENDHVASVDDKGNVTPHAVGETVIWANVENGLAILECEVTVEKSGVSDLQIRGWEENCTLGLRKDAKGKTIGDTGQLKVYFDQTDTKWKRVKWESDNPSAVKLLQGSTEKAEIVGETTVLVKAVGAGSANISAAIVDENGEPVEQGKGQAVCTVTVQEQAEAPEISPADQPVALTNTQTTLHDVILPEGWNWKEPETALTQFAGGKSKRFAAVYQPDTEKNKLSSERLLEVYFLTVNGLSMEVQKEGEDISSLQSGQTTVCYVNYFDEETIQKFENPETTLKENAAYKKHKEEIEKNLQWTSSNPKVAEVESVGNGVELTAKEAGTTTLKAQLKLGKKTFSASRKITVTKAAGTLTVTAVEGFQPVSDAESVSELKREAEKTYIGLLSGFKTEKANEVNSKILLTLPGAAKVTAKSNNAKVVAVKTSAVAGDGFAVSLIVKAAGTARITLTGNDAGKTSQEIILVVDDAEPGLSEETVTVNTLQDIGTEITVYPAKSLSGEDYAMTDVKMGSDEKSRFFKLSPPKPDEMAVAGTVRYVLKAKSGTKNGTYKVKLLATAGGTEYELPLTVKVISTKPTCRVKQVGKLNLFEKDAYSLLEIDTGGVDIMSEEGKLGVVLKGKSAANYYVDGEQKEDGKWAYYLRARENVAVNSIKKGELSIKLQDYTDPLTIPFTANVEKRVPKITWESSKAIFYPSAGMTSVWVGVKNPEVIPWEEVAATLTAGGKNNYDSKVEIDKENGGFILKGSNLNQAETVRASLSLRADRWTEPLSCTLTIQVSKGQPGIALTSKTLQLNANAAYKGYDAAAATVKWNNGGTLLVDSKDKSFRVSVYCDAKDKKAKDLVQNSQVVFSVTRGPEKQTYQKYQIGAQLNNKDVASGTYKFIVQAAQNGNVWKTPLTLKVVNTAPDKAVKITAKGSIDVLNREGSFMTLTPSLKAVNGSFVIPESSDKELDKKVELRGRDAHLFRAKWDAAGAKIELRAKPGETLVTKYKYTVTPVIMIENANGDTEELILPSVSFQVKQGSAKVTASPKTALMYSGAYNSVEIDMKAVLKGADDPEIENVTLVGNTDAFTYEYNKEGKGTLTMNRTGCAVKGKSYSLQFRVSFAEQADNVKPVTVRYTVKVK